MKPVLTFAPQMFAAAMARRKDVTRRVISDPNYLILLRDGKIIPCGMDGIYLPPPYGPAGTILPIAATWAASADWDTLKPTDIEPDIVKGEIAAQISKGLWFDDGTEKPGWAGKSRPARFLPKSLYHLAPQVQILSTRAVPLQEITDEDALREGTAHREGYQRLWDSINATRNDGLYIWAKNPLVWRIEFKLLS